MRTKEKLRHLRSRSGLSVRAVTEAMGYKSPASYNLYETRYDRPYLPVEFVKKLLPCFVGRGNPAIEEHEIWALAEPSFQKTLSVSERHGREEKKEGQEGSIKIDTRGEASFPSLPKVSYKPSALLESFPKEEQSMIEEVFLIQEGEVTLCLPKNLSSESAEDLVGWFALLQKKMQRRIRR